MKKNKRHTWDEYVTCVKGNVRFCKACGIEQIQGDPLPKHIRTRKESK